MNSDPTFEFGDPWEAGDPQQKWSLLFNAIIFIHALSSLKSKKLKCLICTEISFKVIELNFGVILLLKTGLNYTNM